jgi:hypothetical protein
MSEENSGVTSHGGRSRSGHLHRWSGHRVPLLAGAAAVGALGVILIGPANPGHDLATASSVVDSAAQLDTTPTADGAVSAQAASAIPQAQGRAHTIAELNEERAAAAQAAADAAEQAAAQQAAEDSGAGSPDDFRAYAKEKVGATQFSCLDKLWNRESHWRPTAQNPSSTAYGIAQLLDSTWAYTGVRKTSNGYRQVDAGLAYVDAAYGSPCAAWAHETDAGWY